MFLAEQADRTNAVVASGKALAQLLKISEPTISRALKILSEKKDGKEPYLEILKSGGTNVFVLNPNIIWSAWKTGKDYCLFGNAKILLSTNEQDTTVKKRLNVILEKQQNLDLLD
jgi:DNA-binding transcriptional regulator YdaS (Cro superfamily)